MRPPKRAQAAPTAPRHDGGGLVKLVDSDWVVLTGEDAKGEVILFQPWTGADVDAVIGDICSSVLPRCALRGSKP